MNTIITMKTAKNAAAMTNIIITIITAMTRTKCL